MNQVLFVYGSQTGDHLRYNLQRHLHFHPPRASDETLKGLSLPELHRIEITASGSTKMEDRGNIWVADAGCGARLAQETKSSRFVTQISFADDLQGYRIPEIDIERLVGDAHRPTTQLDGSASLVQHHFILVKPSSLRPTVSLPQYWLLVPQILNPILRSKQIPRY